MSGSVLGFIPARGGSQGIPRKNLVQVGGLPLIAHTIQASVGCKGIDKTVVSTEDEEIGETALRFQAQLVPRSPRLAGDRCQIEPAMIEALDVLAKKEGCEPETIVLLQPTSPLRRAEDIDSALKIFHESEADSLLSVYHFPYFLWEREGNWGKPLNYDFNNRPRHQDMEQFRENGAIYITRVDFLRRSGCRLGGKIALYCMKEETSLEIDTPFHLFLARSLLEGGEVSTKSVSQMSHSK